MTAALALVVLAGPAAATAEAVWPPPAAIAGALDAIGDADLVLWDRARVLVATRVAATPERLRAALIEPATYRRAVPSFRRAEVLETRGAERLVAWELEIPLWNLKGRLWLRPRADGVDLLLVQGDLAPGQFHVSAVAHGDGARLVVDGEANVREANWVARRLAARSPLAEPAMTATAAWVLARALALEALRPDPRRRPAGAPVPPRLAELDGRALGQAAPALPRAPFAAAVRSRADGHLDRVEVAVSARLPEAEVARRLLEPARWRVLPGWRKVTPRAGPAWDVDTSLPFVDLDAVWTLRTGPPLRAEATEGDVRGAVFGWDLLPAGARTTMVFSLYPRLERSGWVARKFIAAEPLLEHGLALGLAFVDAASLAQALVP